MVLENNYEKRKKMWGEEGKKRSTVQHGKSVEMRQVLVKKSYKQKKKQGEDILSNSNKPSGQHFFKTRYALVVEVLTQQTAAGTYKQRLLM